MAEGNSKYAKAFMKAIHSLTASDLEIKKVEYIIKGEKIT